MSHPPPSPHSPSPPVTASTKQPSDQEPHYLLHPPIQSVVTPPNSYREPSSSPLVELHNHQTQNIIQHLRKLQDGRIHLLCPWQVFSLNHHEFETLGDNIKAEGATLAAYFQDKVRYDYFYFWQQLVLRMPLPAHEIVIRDIDAEIVTQLRAKTSPPEVKALKSLGSTTYNLPDDPHRGRDDGYSSHSPDASFGLADEQYPGVVLEVANTQKAKSLEQIADDYIVGSDGHVRVLVAVKFNYARSKKATLSVWRSVVARNADGAWEHSCENTMREAAFRDEHGQPIPTCPGLELQLCDFALALRDEPESPTSRIYIPPAQLCSIVNEAEQSQSRQDQPTKHAADKLPLGIIRKKRQRTPQEQITAEDEAIWKEAEEQAEKKRRTEHSAWAGHTGKDSDERSRMQTRSQKGKRENAED